MFFEGLRTDSLYVGPFRISQVVGALCFIAGMGLMVAGFVLAKKGKLDKWLTVRWAEAVPAEGVAVAETDAEDTIENGVENGVETQADENAADPAEEGAPLPTADDENTAADNTDTE